MDIRFRCSSVGPCNNGLVKECNFETDLDDRFFYHCPICGTKLKTLTAMQALRAQKGTNEAR